MSIFIKAGLWSQKAKGFLGEFNLTKYIKDLIAETPVEGGVTKIYVDAKVATSIPLTGTTPSNPVSGEIEVLETAKGIWSKGGSYPDDYSGIFLGEGSSGLYFRNLFDNNEVSIRTYDSGVVISDNRLTAIGLTGLQDFSPNITDLDYTQKIYVDALLPQVANDFANDAAAAIGGIAVGRLYHTAGVVKIRLS